VGGGQVLRYFSLEAQVVRYIFRLFQGSDQQWYVTIEHVNGQALYTSEGYTRKESAIESLKNFIQGVRAINPNHSAEDIVATHTHER